MMRIYNLIIGFVFVANSLNAQAPEGNAMPGDNYGDKVTIERALSITRIPVLLKKQDTVKVKVRTIVLSSCAQKGCWLSVRVNDTTSAMVKMKDYSFFVPTAISGKEVVLEGIAYNVTTTVEELKHYAEDEKKSQAEIDSIKEPKKEIRFLANGLLVVK